MFMFTNKVSRPNGFLALGILVLCLAPIMVDGQAVTARTRLTAAQYERLLSVILPCPEPTLSETADFQLCVLIVPPGHRYSERELLVILRGDRGGSVMTLAQPEQSLWQFANEQREKGATDIDIQTAVKVHRYQTADTKIAERVVGRSWANLAVPLLAQGGWYTDATSYRVNVQRVTGTLVVTTTGPGADAKRQPSRFLVWAERVRQEAEQLLRRDLRN